MRKLLKFLFSRTFLIGFCIVVQAVILFLTAIYLSQYGLYTYALFTLASVITILYVVSRQDNPIYKLAWVIPIALLPALGWLIYLLGGRSGLPRKKRQRAEEIYDSIRPFTRQDAEIMEQIQSQNPLVGRQFQYLYNRTRMPVYQRTETEYLSPGEEFFARLCEELQKAERFIFMEYFIVQEGRMWDRVLEILVQKAREGVSVKMTYDGFGCLFTLPSGYFKKLEALGIEVHVFNSLRPSLDAFMNYRDHRKITVIDGNVGFTGGNNLADEYINEYPKHGHWKDSSILLRGDAVWSLSLLFLQLWQYYDPSPVDYETFRPTLHVQNDGWVMAFGDSPLDSDLVGELGYMHIIENARQYVSITTPYLILDNEMATALCSAAQSGVQIQIITPGIADKWYVHMVTQSNYRRLIEAGIEIYEYAGGFIHAKTLACDDELAIVGTQNFDFRSFYLHFECGVVMYQSSTVADVRRDHLATLEHCRRITMEDCRKRSRPVRLLQILLNLFAPLM